MRALRLEPGQVFLQEHRVLRVLGKGSMGVVYLTESTLDGQRRALKLLLPDALQDERALERFQREATASQQIQSEHVVKTFAAGIDQKTQTPWILMEYVQGKQLGELFEESTPSHRERREWLDQLFEAMTAVHEAGIVHRDLKPENIVVTQGPQGLKILDFGVAKRLGLSPNNSTAQGLGTPMWTAPEQGSSSRGLTPGADVWALGLLAFYILSGRLYWREANQTNPRVLEVILEITKGAIVPPSERLRELNAQVALPPSFDAWFARCVARDPGDRFADAGEASRFLREVLDRRPSTIPPPRSMRIALQPPASTSTPPTAPASAPASAQGNQTAFAVLVIAAAALAGVLVVVAAYFALGR